MRQLIGIGLVALLTLAVMPAPGSAQRSGHVPILSGELSAPSPTAAGAVPNFISYRDRSRIAAGVSTGESHRIDPDDCGGDETDADPTGLLAPTVPIPPPRPR